MNWKDSQSAKWVFKRVYPLKISAKYHSKSVCNKLLKKDKTSHAVCYNIIYYSENDGKPLSLIGYIHRVKYISMDISYIHPKGNC